MELEESVGKLFAMSAGVKTKKADMETNKNGLNSGIWNWDGVVGESCDVLKRDTEGRYHRDNKEGIPERWAHTSMLNSISFVATGKNTALVFGTKSGSSTPVIRDSANVCEG